MNSKSMSRRQREWVNDKEDNVKWRTCLSLGKARHRPAQEATPKVIIRPPTPQQKCRRPLCVVVLKCLYRTVTTARGGQRTVEVGDTSTQPRLREPAQSVPRLCVCTSFFPLRWCTALVQCRVTVRCKCFKKMRRMTGTFFSQAPMTNEDSVRVLHDFKRRNCLDRDECCCGKEDLLVRQSVCV